MSARTSSNDEHFSVSQVFAGGDCAPDEFYTGERVCASGPIKRRGLLRRLVLIALIGAGAWGWHRAPEAMKAEVLSAAEILTAKLSELSLKPAAAPIAEPEVAATQTPPPLPDAKDVASAPPVSIGEAVPTPADTSQSQPPGAAKATHDTAAIEIVNELAAGARAEETPLPLPPPVADSSDPLQKRALAAGLHPDVSRTVLARLSKADFSNAAKAIKTALAQSSAAGVYAWPKGAGDKTALFEVKFVKGSDPSCRRYVVTVTKTRWSTTAPAMETCSGKPKWSSAKASG